MSPSSSSSSCAAPLAQQPHVSDFNHQLLKGLAAGVLAAAVSKSAVAPMDRVKLVLQLQSCCPSSSSSSSAPSLCFRPYRGILDCFRRLCAEQGFHSLWRGNSAAVLRCFPNQVLNLALRDKFRLIFLQGPISIPSYLRRPQGVDRKRQSVRFVFGNLAAGGAGGAATLLAVYPLDLARTRLALLDIPSAANPAPAHPSSNDPVRSLRHCLARVHSAEGLVGLYRGFCASLLFTVVSRAIFFGIFDSVRLSLADGRQRQLSFAATWSLAQASIVVSSLLCYPLDSVRRRLMMEAGQQHKPYGSQWNCWRAVLRQEGPAALYKGALSNSLRCTSGALILAVYYELLKYIC